ncbi:Putative metalloendopeptidase [Salinispira pacifica]|uniref:Putative metalloendopeptidase n=2 Tax=Salinispira pacifica TaxID=1307761 RepID=V5WGL3_9SPIO|nr:Putative metalloendopeptidase [Salinispira pacifica]
MRSDSKNRKPVFSNIKAFFRKSSAFVKSLVKQKFTVMFIPHSEKKVVNFQVSTILLAFVAAILLGMVGGFFYMTTVYAGSEQVISEQEDDLVVTQGNLDTVLDEVNDLVKVYEIFENAMSGTLNELGVSNVMEGGISGSGDLSSISDLQEINNGEVREIYDLRRLRESISDAVGPLENISFGLEVRKEVLANLPTLWPVAGGRSAVTMEFGPNIHPINGNWYLHKGIDIAGPMGLPIQAAANGRVVESGVNNISGYGNYVVIEHKYGFKTRYSHMGSRLVEEGDIVSQGDRIGTLGSTGKSSGPHLDFQIMLGTEVLDPASFLKIQNTFERWEGNR